jgi:hypothetical protein
MLDVMRLRSQRQMTVHQPTGLLELQVKKIPCLLPLLFHWRAPTTFFLHLPENSKYSQV